MIRENLIFCCFLFSFNAYFQTSQSRCFLHELNQATLNQVTLLVTQKDRSLITIISRSLLNCYLIACSLCSNTWDFSTVRKGYSVISLSRLKVFKSLISNRKSCNSTFCFLVACDKGCSYFTIVIYQFTSSLRTSTFLVQSSRIFQGPRHNICINQATI